MKYCIYYYTDFRYLDEVDEIIFPYNTKLPNFFKEKKFKDNQRLIIYVRDEFAAAAMETLLKIREIHPNMAAIIARSKTDIQQMKDNSIPFFFNEYCKTYDQVYTFIKEGVSDVYVVETLGFNLKNIGTYCHNNNVNVRVLPNVLQSTIGSTSQLPQECQFFIRPDDTDLYEPYVDVFELFWSESKLSVNYEIYKEKHWDQDLMFLIQGMKEPMMINSAIPFAKYRLKCHQDCYNCNICTNMKYFHNELAKANLKITKQEEE